MGASNPAMSLFYIARWLVVVCSLCLLASEAVTAADGDHPTEIAKLRAQLKEHAKLLTETRKREAVLKQQVRESKKAEKKAASGSQADLDQQHVDGSSSRLALRTPIMLAAKKSTAKKKKAAAKKSTAKKTAAKKKPAAKKSTAKKKAASRSQASQADLDQQHVDGSSSRLALRTPIMLASCKQTWPFQLQ